MKLFFLMFAIGIATASAQTTITAYGEPKVTIDTNSAGSQKITIECDRFYRVECFKLVSTGPVIVRNSLTLITNSGGVPYTKTGIVRIFF
ncbi:hypothetical protein CHU92_09220 [Flavobacterium cyanobacteriorum]|uniref:Uncharacterized protein n=1 Tax=Flavobacterium cyanobacteriorum TaxID=2022802 RepID=A0A255Z5N6_9FLAO|nr:hypothetical protein [Flavobacterium cyanobacteriorum]OYQ36766.1 hypothetical protein CHU92_09220 [Flavobacterium cyanobacteriorum]